MVKPYGIATKRFGRCVALKNIQSIQLIDGSNEELLPGFSPDFPYIASCALLDRYLEPATPWHWHRTAELFYMQSGTLEYTTPNGKWVFPAGSGGFVNSNILHASKIIPSGVETVQLLHLFEPELLSGGQASRIDSKYIRPLTSAAGLEMIALSPSDAIQKALLEKIRAVFDLDEDGWGYEFTLRQQLTEIWLALFDLARPAMARRSIAKDPDEKLKAIMRYIHTHYPDTICVDQLAKAAHISKRVCYRLFQENLHMSPVEYITGYRIRKACQRLIETDESITQIAYSCGLGSSSYFGKLFRERFGATPTEYRQKWHDRNTNQQK